MCGDAGLEARILDGQEPVRMQQVLVVCVQLLQELLLVSGSK